MRNKVTVMALILSVILAAYVSIGIFLPLASIDAPLEVNIERGSSFRQAARVLHDHGIVPDRGLFMLLSVTTGLHKRIRAGYYEFQGNLSLWDVYKILREGRIIERTVLVIEGETLWDIRKKLAAAGLISGPEFDRLARDSGFMAGHGVYAPSLEGYLFPDTYSFPKGISARELLSVMIRRMREKLTPLLLEQAAARGLSEREVLTLASIVEKEARLDRERPVVAAVYLNRLRHHMPLQADPTAIYGVKQMTEGVTATDLRRHTEYNTYVFAGLPPGPIASPGLRSIEAVISPADVPYLYFVADGTGGHLFSASYAEHQRAVAAYRHKSRRMNK